MLNGIPNVGKSALTNALHQVGRISAAGIQIIIKILVEQAKWHAQLVRNTCGYIYIYIYSQIFCFIL